MDTSGPQRRGAARLPRTALASLVGAILSTVPLSGLCLSVDASTDVSTSAFVLNAVDAGLNSSADAAFRAESPTDSEVAAGVVISTTPRTAPLIARTLPNRVRRDVDPALHSAEFTDHESADRDAPHTLRTLRSLQARYQRLVDAGGWPVIQAGPAVAPGGRDNRLRDVRARLALTGDIARAGDSDLLDDELVAALARFQTRVQLPPTGHLDEATLTELNVSAAARLMSIALSVSRASNLPHDADQDYVLVNIAGYKAEYRRGDETLWSGRTMVGKLSTRTPQLESAIDRVVFNPTWIVPNGIATRSVLPAVIKDPAYLARKNMRVFDMKWQPVDPDSVDWKAVHASRDRDIYIRQDAGDDNALGKVKFLFPNKYSVFLHDTQSKHLFDTDMRAYSNGCVRLENPMALASAMLDAQGLDGEWLREKAQNSQSPELIALDRPIPVHTLYLTAELGEGGQAIFYRDIYGENTEQSYASLVSPTTL